MNNPGASLHLTLAFLVATLWPSFSSAAGPSEPLREVYTFDARHLNRLDLSLTTNANLVWDTLHPLAALQGLANRQSPRLYLFYCSGFNVDTDQFWLEWFRGEDGWLRNVRLHPLTTLEDALQALRPVFRGLVVYDPAVPATAAVASTAAGCEDLIPVRYDPAPGSVFYRLTRDLKLPVQLWLLKPDGTSMFTGRGLIPELNEPSSGSAKIDAYRWALKKYVHSSKCEPGIAAYYIDSYWLRHPQGEPTMHTLANHDYFISRRGFFFDLSPWGDELPPDDPSQTLGLDRQEFLAVLTGLSQAAGERVLKVGGFPPWPYKYTSHAHPPGRHEGVPTEWEFGRLISQFNGYMEADAAALGGMANASFFRHYPLAKYYPQPNQRPGLAEWRAKGLLTPTGQPAPKLFVAHYVGDYDAPSWLYKAVPAFFADPKRGQVPLAWAFDPNLSDRAPQALVYAYRHATTNDFFIAGDSGAGYLNPRALTVRPESRLPSGLDQWSAHCLKYYQRWGMTITGFMLDGSAGASTDLEFRAYRTFSPDGAGTHYEDHPALHDGLPTCREQDLPDDVEQAARILGRAAQSVHGNPGFFWARSILRPPAWYARLNRRLEEQFPQAGIVTVDPYTFFGLIRLQLRGTN